MPIVLSGSLELTGSVVASGNFTTTGNITAQTLVVQTITSSINYITGSSDFGSLQSNRHTFTGSLFITGSTSTFSGCINIGGSLSGTSATFSSIVGVGGNTEAGWSLKSNGNLKVENNNGTTVLQVNDTSTGGKTWSLVSSGAGNTHSVPAGSFYLRNSTDSITAFTVSGCGNVGIGTCNSTAVLELAKGVSGGIGPILFLRKVIILAFKASSTWASLPSIVPLMKPLLASSITIISLITRGRIPMRFSSIRYFTASVES